MSGWDVNKYGGYKRNPEDEVSNINIQDLIMRNPQAFQRDPEGFLKMHGVVLPKSISLTDAKATAKERSRNIFANWNALRSILDRHEDKIRKRWSKKSRENRKEILQDAWPDISKEHRPEWKALTATAHERGLSGPVLAPDAKYRDAFLLPHLNLEDLTNPKAFLVLLQARGRNSPDTFAFSDYQSAQLGVCAKSIVHELLEGNPSDGAYMMRLAGHTSPESYGSIYSIPSANPGASDVAAELGTIILEIQDRTLDFLVKCAVRVMYTIPPDELFSDDMHPVLEPLPLLSRDSSEVVSIPTLTEEGPYQVPNAMDFETLLSLVEAKRGENEDHMWAMREDPGYFLETVKSRAEHRQESVLDVYGREHAFKGTPRFWNRILINTVQEAYNYVLSWTIVHDYLKRIVEIQRKYASSISLDKPLPAELENELLSYKEFIEIMLSTPLLQVSSAIPGSPECRNWWIRDHNYPDPNVVSVNTKKPVLNDYLLMLFTILQDKDRREAMGLQNIMDEIERLIRRNPKDKERISPMVAKMFSDLALTGELERQLKLYQPRLYEPFYKPNPNLNVRIRKKAFLDVLGSMMAVVDHMDELPVVDVGTPIAGRFNYPADKRRTKETVDQMRFAEANLDIFWQRVDKAVLTSARGPRGYSPGKIFHVLYPDMITNPRVLQRTGPWVEPMKKPVTAKKPDVPVKENLFELELRTQRTIATDEKASSKSKVKTRGLAEIIPAKTKEPLQVLDVSHSTEPQRFTVNKRVHKVFSAMFHDPASPDRPGEVAWQDFLYAMAAAGFMFEKLYGSVWKFTPTGTKIQRPINFHEPHPEKKMPLAMARTHGRRLNRAYGWVASTFLLE